MLSDKLRLHEHVNRISHRLQGLQVHLPYLGVLRLSVLTCRLLLVILHNSLDYLNKLHKPTNSLQTFKVRSMHYMVRLTSYKDSNN